MNGKVFVFGSINTDMVVYIERLPQPGETVSGGVYASFPGGKGANQAVAAARASGGAVARPGSGAAARSGGDTAVEMFGCLGDDSLGRERLASLEATGVSTRGVRLVAGTHSGIAQITVDAEGENTIVVAPGANMVFDAKDVAVSRPAPGERCVSLFQNEVPQEAVEALIAATAAAGHLVLWNLAPTIARRPAAQTLRAVDFLICNENELLALTAQEQSGDAGAAGGHPVAPVGAAAPASTDYAALARLPLSWGVKNCIVTLGRRGSIWVGARGTHRQEAFPVEAVDTVGAGDCFCGVFAASLAAGLSVEESLRKASAAAALSTTRKGAQPSMPTAAEIEEFLRSRAG